MNWTYLLGLDFGVRDENALAILAWRPHDVCVYIAEAYRFKAIPSEMAEEVQRLDQTYKFERIVGDVGGLGKAFSEEMRRRFQIPVEPAEKHNKLGNIALFNGDLERGRIKVVGAKCGDLLTEWAELPWTADGLREADGFNNHAADAVLYAWRAAYAYTERPKEAKPKPGSPEALAAEEDELFEARMEKLRREQEKEWWDR